MFIFDFYEFLVVVFTMDIARPLVGAMAMLTIMLVFTYFSQVHPVIRLFAYLILVHYIMFYL